MAASRLDRARPAAQTEILSKVLAACRRRFSRPSTAQRGKRIPAIAARHAPSHRERSDVRSSSSYMNIPTRLYPRLRSFASSLTHKVQHRGIATIGRQPRSGDVSVQTIEGLFGESPSRVSDSTNRGEIYKRMDLTGRSIGSSGACAVALYSRSRLACHGWLKDRTAIRFARPSKHCGKHLAAEPTPAMRFTRHEWCCASCGAYQWCETTSNDPDDDNDCATSSNNGCSMGCR